MGQFSHCCCMLILIRTNVTTNGSILYDSRMFPICTNDASLPYLHLYCFELVAFCTGSISHSWLLTTSLIQKSLGLSIINKIIVASTIDANIVYMYYMWKWGLEIIVYLWIDCDLYSVTMFHPLNNFNRQNLGIFYFSKYSSKNFKKSKNSW